MVFFFGRLSFRVSFFRTPLLCLPAPPLFSDVFFVFGGPDFLRGRVLKSAGFIKGRFSEAWFSSREMAKFTSQAPKARVS